MRLEFRVMAWMAVLLGAAAALALTLMSRFETERLEQQWSEAGRVMAEATENSLEVSMLNNSPEDIRQSVRNVEEGKLVDSVTVYRRNGTSWVSSTAEPTISEGRRSALLASMGRDQVVTESGEGTLSVFVPIRMKPECVGCHAQEESSVLGAVEVRLDERPFQSELVRSARYSLIFAALPLLLGIVLSVWAIRRSVLRPLAEVGEAAEKIGEGDLSVRLPEYKSWELSEVSETFNDMASRLERQATDLRDTVDALRSELGGLEEIQGLLTSGAGIGVVLSRAAGHLGPALEASGVGIWRVGAQAPDAVWGTQPPDGENVQLAAGGGRVLTSEGDLRDVSEDKEIGWVMAPARIGGRVLAVVGVGWDPARRLGHAERDLLVSLSGLVAVAVENADLIDRLQDKEQRLQSVLRKTITAQEEERRRLSRELHDETSQVLSALMMNIDLLETQAPVDEPSRARVEAVKNLAEEAARNLDKMLLDLRPALLDELGLMPALRWYLAQVSDLWGLPIEFEGGKTARLPDHLEVAAFRIVQEAVSNVARHAKASKASVQVVPDTDMLRIEVDDDGIGFDVVEASARARTGEAVGLAGMRERAELSGGTFEVESTIGEGTRVRAEIPMPALEGAEVT